MRRRLLSLLLVSMLVGATVPSPTLGRQQLAGASGEGRIAFASNLAQPNTGSFDLYAVGADGTDLTRLTSFGDEGMEARAPTWAPDGSRIAFGGRDISQAGMGIYLMEADGGNVFQLFDPGDCNDYDFFEWHGPAWAPDGTRLAFAADRERRCGQGVRPDLYLADASGANVTRLTTLAEQGDSTWMPDWSPDGSQVVFVSGPSDAIGHCYVVPAAGGDPTPLGTSDAGCFFPAWSPDGTQIAVVGPDGIGLVPAAGGEVTDLMAIASGLVWDQAWSPDGTKLLFEKLEIPAEGEEYGPSPVYVLDVATGAVTTIATNSAFAVAPAWSPDGSRIVFAGRLDGQPGTDLYTVASDGTDSVRVTTVGDDGAIVSGPAWDPAA